MLDGLVKYEMGVAAYLRYSTGCHTAVAIHFSSLYLFGCAGNNLSQKAVPSLLFALDRQAFGAHEFQRTRECWHAFAMKPKIWRSPVPQ